MTFSDFVIHFESTLGGEYRVRVLESPAGEGVEPLQGLSVRDTVGMATSLVSHGEKDGEGAILAIGRELFSALLTGAIGTLYQRSLGMVERSGEGIRVVLRIDQSDQHLSFLHKLPWEVLYNPGVSEFLALTPTHSIVRRLQVHRPFSLRVQAPPLRVLILAASPIDFAPIDMHTEESQIVEALREITGVEITILRQASLQNLHRQLREADFQILHFIGHGSINQESGESSIFLHGPSGVAQPVNGRDLSDSIGDQSSLRLVVLSACEAARATAADRANPLSGIASSLVLAGAPSVVAMQFPISDEGASTFSSTLYRSLASGEPIDAAVARGRIAVRERFPFSIEWAAPALFARATGKDIFVISRDRGKSTIMGPPEFKGVESVSDHDSGSRDTKATEAPWPATGTPDEGSLAGADSEGFGNALTYTRVLLRQVETSYEDTRRDARIWSITSVAAAGLGLGMVSAAIVSWILHSAEVSAVTGILGGISTAIFALYFRNWRLASGRLAAMVGSLEELRKIVYAQQIAQTMETAEERDKAKALIVKGLVNGLSEPRQHRP